MNTIYDPNKKIKITDLLGGSDPEIELDRKNLIEYSKELKKEIEEAKNAKIESNKQNEDVLRASTALEQAKMDERNANNAVEKEVAEKAVNSATNVLKKEKIEAEEAEKRNSKEQNDVKDAEKKKEDLEKKRIKANSPQALRKRAAREQKKAQNDPFLTRIIELKGENKDPNYEIGNDDKYKAIIADAEKKPNSYMGKKIAELKEENTKKERPEDPYYVYNDQNFKEFLENSIKLRVQETDDFSISDLFAHPDDLYSDWTKMITLLGKSLDLTPIERESLAKSLADIDLKFIDNKLIEDIKKMLESDLKLAEFERKNITKSKDKDLIASYTLLKENLAKMQLLSSQNFLKIKKLITDGPDGKNVNDILKLFIDTLNLKVGTVNQILEKSGNYKGEEDNEKDISSDNENSEITQSGGSELLEILNMVNKYLKYKIKYLQIKTQKYD